MKLPTASGSPNFISQRVSEARRYYLNLKPARECDLVVVCGGVERCGPDYEICRSTFPYAGVEFVAEGLGTLEMSGKTYPLRPGTMFAYASGVAHRICNNPQAPMLKYYVDFAGKKARALLKASPLGHWEAVQVSSPGEISEVFELLNRNGAIPTAQTPAVCMHLVSLLLLKVSELAVPFGAVESRAFPTYQRIRHYVETHYLQLHSVEAVAKACHINGAYLCRLFQRFAQHTPYQLLLRLKMERAATLLIEADMPIKTVAATLGFSDPFHFSRSFKRLYGLAPALFIEQGRRQGTPNPAHPPCTQKE